MTNEDAEGHEWYSAAQLSGDGHLKRLSRWKRHFRPYIEREPTVLDVGCGAGAAAIFFANYLPNALITCIDSQDDDGWNLFKLNLSKFYGKIRRERGGVLSKLELLAEGGGKFDIIHIDRVRNRDYAIASGLMAWSLLRFGGTIIWNEYEWGPGRPSDKRPHDAINLILALKEREAKVVWSGSQCVVRKLRPADVPVE